MRKLMFILFLGVSNYIFCQNSFPTLSDNPQWNVYGSDNVWGGINFNRQYSFEKDTTFSGYQYTKLLINPSGPYNAKAYIRVDSERVFIRFIDTAINIEHLMYDFSLNIGDTTYCGFKLLGSIPFWVTNIDTVNIKGINRKRLQMAYYAGNPPFGFTGFMDWIKGIGSMDHPFYPAVCLYGSCETSYDFICYDSAGIQLYQNPNYSSCNVVGIKSKKYILDILASPNPSNGIFNLQLPTNYATLFVYDVLGKIVKKEQITNNYSLNLKNQPNGIYFLKVKSEENEYYKKLVKY